MQFGTSYLSEKTSLRTVTVNKLSIGFVRFGPTRGQLVHSEPENDAWSLPGCFYVRLLRKISFQIVLNIFLDWECGAQEMLCISAEEDVWGFTAHGRCMTNNDLRHVLKYSFVVVAAKTSKGISANDVLPDQ